MERLLHSIFFAVGAAHLLLLIFSVQNTPFVSAAPPIVVTGSRYITVNGTLYVQGGGSLYAQGGAFTDTDGTTAFSSLDMSVPWNQTSPPWKAIVAPAGFLTRDIIYQGLAVTPDKTRLVFWGSFNAPPEAGSLSILNIPSNSWSSLTVTQNPNLTSWGISAVIDPTSGGMGVLYAPSGCTEQITGTENAIPGLCMIGLDKKTTTYQTMSRLLVPSGIAYYSFVYCTLRKTMLLYGGAGANNEPNQSLYEFSPSNSTWSLLQPQGTSPGDIQRHCMVETTDGTKMIVFGGMNVGLQVSARLSIFHIKNMTWTDGADVGAANARMGHVCATNGDSFIVWGGLTLQNGKAVVVNNVPLIYNIPKNEWVHNFVVTNPPPPTLSNATLTSTMTGPMPSSSDNASLSSPSEKSSNVGAIVGGAAGSIIAVAAIGFFMYRRRKGNGLSHSKRSGDGNLRRSMILNGGGNDIEDDKDACGNHSGANAIQLQSESVQRSVDSYSHSPPHSVQQFQSSPLQTKNSFAMHGGNSRELNPEIDMRGHHGRSSSELGSPRFSGSKFSNPPPPFQSTLSLSPAGSPQAYLGPFPMDQQNHPYYYDKGRSDFPSPFRGLDHTNILYSDYPQFTPIGLDSQGNRFDLRSPQQPGPGVETSPAAWMAAMNTRNSFGNSHRLINHGSHVSGHIGGLGSYFPPPPGLQSPAEPEPDLLQKKLMLMKAQHELDVEKMRLEQESQRHLVERQLVERQLGPAADKWNHM
ncbi:hypothetical protein EMPS_04828 [Entomortierella parvispora]|uniref:Uncharacterized protein n=1 Tax=Entomortierella parvispora TaxID=205924 RepID=A0A9P3H9J3_9FUNG|nr:hypothetical protein EMPS_04828 [Entomortierella parvispora]